MSKKTDLSAQPGMAGASQGWLIGSCLIAMPAMTDPRFNRTIIFLCSHDEEGAMGLVVNRPHQNIDFQTLCEKLKLSIPEESLDPDLTEIPVLAGGPVEIGRGFVLHRITEGYSGSLQIADDLALCATMEAIQGLAAGVGPLDARIALGYAGWGAGQLEEEIRENSWLVCDADVQMILKTPPEEIYPMALKRLGVDLGALVSTTGHA